jgi:hypothetical protein
VIVDSTAAARRADPDRVREWLAEQRVFISSAMGDTAIERRAVAEVIEELSARTVWFEEFGRDADAEEAYLTEVDASTIYVGILNEFYGRPNPPDGDSATEMEYSRARANGRRVNVYVAANVAHREGALSRFIDRVRFFVTTENYDDSVDLARRVRRRLEELAAETLSPWIKIGDLVFRADEVDDAGETIRVRARVSEEIAHQFETLRDQRYGRDRLRFVSRSRVADGELVGVRRTTRAGGAEELTVELARVRPPQSEAMRAGTSGYSADELIELGIRALFLGEAVPEQVGMLGFMTEPGISVDDLRQAFDLPNEFAEAVVRLIIADGLVGSGHARRIVSVAIGPRNAAIRRLALEWEDPRVYTNMEPARRHIEGDWRRPKD